MWWRPRIWLSPLLQLLRPVGLLLLPSVARSSAPLRGGESAVHRRPGALPGFPCADAAGRGLLCEASWTRDAAVFSPLPRAALFLSGNAPEAAAVPKLREESGRGKLAYRFPAESQRVLAAMFEQVVRISGGCHNWCQTWHGHGLRSGAEVVVVFHTHEYCKLNVWDEKVCEQELPAKDYPSQGFIVQGPMCKALAAGKAAEQAANCPQGCAAGADPGRHVVVYRQAGETLGAFYYLRSFSLYLRWLVTAFDPGDWEFELSYLPGAFTSQAFGSALREELVAGGEADINWRQDGVITCTGTEDTCRRVFGGAAQ